MWTGYAMEITNVEEMALLLDVVVPLQVRLGELFCTAEIADCRPSELLSIELADARPSSARLLLTRYEHGTRHDIGLTLLFLGGRWVLEPNSLAQYLVTCRAAPTGTAP